MTERNGARLAAVLPADANLQLGTNSTSILDSNPYESPYSFGVKNLKWIVC